MKSVFARISTAIVAAAAVAASALVFAPAASAAGFTNPAVSSSNWGFEAYNQDMSTTSVQGEFVTGATNMSASVGFRMGGTEMASRAGHTIRVTWNKSFPSGVNWNTSSSYGSANGVDKYLSPWAYGPTVSGTDPYQMGDTTTATWNSADSNTFVIPSSFSTASSSDSMMISTGIQVYVTDWAGAVVGSYSMAPALYDVTAGADITYGSWSATTTSIANKDASTNGSGDYANATIPAGVNFHQNFTTCVPVSAMTAGDILQNSRVVDGTSTAMSWSSLNKKGSYTSAGNFDGNGRYTVQTTDVDSSATGLRWSSAIYKDNTQGLSAISAPSFDAVIKKFATGTTDFTTGGTVVNTSCAPAQLAAPTFTLTDLSQGTVSWTKATEETTVGSMNYRLKIFRASDLTVPVVTTSVNGALTGSTYTGNVFLWPALTAGVDYVAEISAWNNSDGVYSVDSAPSNPSTKITPPPTPNAPTGLTVTSSRATATLVVTDGTATYNASLYNAADLTTAVSGGSCTASTPGATTLTCTVNATMTPFNAPAQFKMRVRASKNGIMSDWSAFTAAVTGGYPGVSVTPSGGTANGEAKTLTTTFPWITDTFPSMYGPGASAKAFIINDAKGNYYAFKDVAAVGSTGRKYQIQKIKSDNTGFDGAAIDKVVTGPTTMGMPSAAFFAGATKIATSTNVSNCDINGCNQLVSPKLLFTESTVAGAISTTTDLYATVQTFCSSNMDAGAGQLWSGSGNIDARFVALQRPVLNVYCNAQNGNQQFLATVNADMTLTKLTSLNSINANQNYLSTSSVSQNPNATGSQIATVYLVIRSLRSANSPYTYSNYERALIRVAANGTVTEATGVYTPSGSEPSYSLAAVNDGTTVYGLINSMGANSLVTIPVAAGNFGTPRPLIVDAAGSSSFRFPSASVPAVAGEIALIRTDNGMNGQSFGPARLTVSTARVITGEMLPVSVAGTPMNYSYIDAAGNMNMLITPALNPTPTTHTVIQWKGVRAMVAQPTPTYMGKDIAFSINAGGATVTITGSDLALTTAAKKVNSVTVGSKIISTITKTATSIKFVVPTAALAGVVGTPTPQSPSIVPVTIQLGSGASLSAGTMTYVGADKLAQTITNTTAELAAFVGSPDRNITASLTTLVQAATPLLTPTAAPATVCTVVAGKVHFVGAGNCVVTAASAGNSYLVAGTTVSKTIVVSRQNQSLAVTLATTPAYVGSPDRDVTVVNTTSLTAAPAVVPVASPSTVCTLVSGKVRFVGAGTCTVKTAAALSATYNASNVDTKTIVVSRQNQSLAVTLDTANALVGEADRTISIVNTTSLTAAPAVVPVLTPSTVCTLVGGKVHFVGPGVCTVKSSAPLSATYNASNIDTKTITVRKPDTITVTMGDIQTDDSVDGFQVPAAATSARTIVYAIDPSSAGVCTYDASMSVVKGNKTRVAGNNTCKVNLTIAQDATWGAATYQAVLTIINEPDTGTAASNPKNVANTNTPVSYKYMQYIWNRTTGSISMKLNSTWVGPNTAKITWTQGGTTYTCTSAKFGTMTKVTGAQITANKTYTSTNFCLTATAATKAALKNIASNTVVKLEITREVRYPATYAVKYAAFRVAPIFLTLGD